MQKHIYGISGFNYYLLDTVSNMIQAVIVKSKYKKSGFDNLIITDKKITPTQKQKVIIL